MCQNGEEFFRLISGNPEKATSAQRAQDEVITEAILKEETGGGITDNLEGGELVDADDQSIDMPGTPDLLR